MKIDELTENHDFVGKPVGWNNCKKCGKYMTYMLQFPDDTECE